VRKSAYNYEKITVKQDFDTHLSASHHDVIFTRLTAGGVVRADMMFNAPLARVLAVCALCAAAH